MQPTTRILENINRNSTKNHDEIFTRLYRYMLRPDLYYIAYKNLYANKGAATKGVNDDTADGFSESYVNKIIERLKDGSYQPNPARRTYILKANGKKRPLGIPTFADKLVQEVLRMILEAVYEPVFRHTSHGFRPNRSCHTALMQIRKGFNGVRWFVEGDIKGCFDNIDHNTLVGIIGKKIKDARLIQLIYRFLRAGYMENWQHNSTHSGTPQGGIVSPILANIYLNELDKFVEAQANRYQQPRSRTFTPEYAHMSYEIRLLRKRIGLSSGEEKDPLLKQLREKQRLLHKIPCSSQTDKVLKYVRYADDFLIGVKGDKADCEQIKAELREYISTELHMELSDEKTYITHSDEYARFLGYDVRVRRNGQIKRMRAGVTGRTLSNMVELNIPLQDKIEACLLRSGAARRETSGSGLAPQVRKDLLRLSELEIVNTYNAELRGICNFYNMASNFGCLNYLTYLMHYSCLHTLARKYKCSIGKVKERFKDGHGGWAIPYETKDGPKRMYLCKHSDCKKSALFEDAYPQNGMIHKHSPSTFETRLKAKTCELCGSTDSKHFDIHHVNRLKNLSGKAGWERFMLAKRRKTVVVCEECHAKIHSGKPH